MAVTARTPAEEIRRAHLERAQQLLGETDQSILAVAEASGFGSPEYMAHHFKAALGRTPLQYRKQFRCEHPQGMTQRTIKRTAG
jgi:LacI family transcriptional regulator